jgi:CRISPR-associated endonuclease/helicase Cas3
MVVRAMRVQEVYQKVLGEMPYEHQQKAWDALMQGKSVILRAPTGSGKTEAVFLPFCNGARVQLPSRLIYALPLRSLANQIAERLQKHAEKLGKSNLRIALQHGQKPESVLFAADVVIATIDQVVSSYACAPLTLPLRHGNIPAGAVASSFLVFDEVHLFDPELALQAVRLICERLHNIGLPFALISATLPDCVLDFWQQNFGCEVIDAQCETTQRTVEIQFCESELSDEAVAKAMKQGHRKILIVLNTVKRAVDLFQRVQSLAKQHGYCSNLLHARFLIEDKLPKEQWVELHFGKNASETKSLLIATQVVEAGLDISADCLLTELAPIDALIQRAGRCARWGGSGIMQVFSVERTEPYEEELVNKTEQILKLDLPVTLSWEQTKKWVNEVLSERYSKVLNGDTYYEQVVAGLSYAAFTGDRSKVAKAIRDTQTVEVTLFSNPHSLGKDVLRLPTISVHIGIVKQWLKDGAKAWRVEVDKQGRDVDVQVECESVTADQIRLGDCLVFEPSKLAYDCQLGLQFGVAGKDFEPLPVRERAQLEGTYRTELWIDHAIKTACWMEKMLERDRLAVEGLAKLLGIPREEVKRAGKLAALLHDFGKLTVEWQQTAGVDQNASANELLAHTATRDYTPFPSHATVSAYALWEVLREAIPSQLGKALLFAIAHHHSVRARQVPKYRLHPSWQQAINEALKRVGLDSVQLQRVQHEQPSDSDLRDRFPPLEYERLYTTYVLLAKWLRLADRMATEGREDAVFRYEDWFGRL